MTIGVLPVAETDQRKIVFTINQLCERVNGGKPNNQTGTTYEILQSDEGKVVSFSNASPVAVTLPQAGTGGKFDAGWTSFFVNQGAGLVTITPTTSTIDGGASITLATDQGVIVTSDGTNYQIWPGNAIGNIFYPSGTNHRIGLVPDPGAVAGTGKFLREDATWQVPSYTLVDEISIRNFPSVDLTGATDSSAALNVAIASLPVSGGTLTFPAGSLIKISNPVFLGNGVGSPPALSTRQGIRLKSVGAVSIGGAVLTPAQTPCKFFWGGGAGGTMFTVLGPLVGWGFDNILIDGQSNANIGLLLLAAQGGDCTGLTIQQCKLQQLYCDTYDTFTVGAGFTSGTANTMHNTFTNLTLTCPDLAGAMGMICTGKATGQPANTCYMHFIDTTIYLPGTQVKTALYLQACDSLHFTNTHVVYGTNSAGVTFDYNVTSAWPAACVFDGIDTGNPSVGGCPVSFQNAAGTPPGVNARTHYVTPFEANGMIVPFLSNLINFADSTQHPPWTVPTGTGDAMVVNYPQAWNNMPDGKLMFLRAIDQNTSTAPTITIQSHGTNFVVGPITKHGTQALVAGDIPRAKYEMCLRYNTAGGGTFELLNPYFVGPFVQWIQAGGSANAITGTYSPIVTTLYDGLVLAFRAINDNTTTTPTFQANATAAKTITKQGGEALMPRDIRTLGEYVVRYYATGNRWELVNTMPAVKKVALNIAATGTTQGTAAALTGHWNSIGTCTAGVNDGVILNASADGEELVVNNGTAATVKVYPPVGGSIDISAVNAHFPIASNKMQIFQRWTSLLYFTLTATHSG